MFRVDDRAVSAAGVFRLISRLQVIEVGGAGNNILDWTNEKSFYNLGDGAES